MIKGKTILGVIPARGGSKRLPNKNIIGIANKPLLAWTIEAGTQSKFIDRLIVTSDNKDILKISSNHGAELIQRPNEISGDYSTTFDAIEHVIENINEDYDFICLLQPTSPLRTSKHIDEAIELLFEKKSDAVISVSEMNENPLWSNTLNDDLDMSDFLKDDVRNKRSQDLKKYYHINGAIYICNIKKFLAQKTFFIKSNIYAYIMKRERSIDIDDDFDFMIAECIMQRNSSLNVE